MQPIHVSTEEGGGLKQTSYKWVKGLNRQKARELDWHVLIYIIIYLYIVSYNTFAMSFYAFSLDVLFCKEEYLVCFLYLSCKMSNKKKEGSYI